MAKRKGKSVSFDAMIKFFLKNYDIPTKRDIEKLATRLDSLEKLIVAQQTPGGRRRIPGRGAKRKSSSGRSSMTAADRTLEIIKRFKQGVSFVDIQIRTGFDEKKLRNIIYRLDKLDKITRKSRGIYMAY